MLLLVVGGSIVSVALVLTGHWVEGVVLFLVVLAAVVGFMVYMVERIARMD